MTNVGPKPIWRGTRHETSSMNQRSQISTLRLSGRGRQKLRSTTRTTETDCCFIDFQDHSYKKSLNCNNIIVYSPPHVWVLSPVWTALSCLNDGTRNLIKAWNTVAPLYHLLSGVCLCSSGKDITTVKRFQEML